MASYSADSKGFYRPVYVFMVRTGATELKEQLIISVNAGVDLVMEPDSYRQCIQYIVLYRICHRLTVTAGI